jgi:hypothetical protein
MLLMKMQLNVLLSTTKLCVYAFAFLLFHVHFSFSLFQVLLMALRAECASRWYTGDNKPYEFGFEIQGNQHRHESKGMTSINHFSS